MVFAMRNGDLAALEARVTAGAYAAYDSLIAEIATSFENMGKRISLSPGLNTGEPCVLRANWEGVTVRVGPGTNRGLLTYLPEGLDYAVQGQAEANDGSLWWKLDPNDVAPNSGANEVWVPDIGVSTTGDCAIVEEAVAPPIIFAPPSLPEGVESPSETDASVIAAGDWLVDIGNPLPCGNTVYEQVDPAPYTAYIIVTDTVIFGDIGFYVINESGDYVGSTLLRVDNDDIAATVRLTLESPTRIVGVISFTRDGCEWPHLVTMTLQ
jgi:hypothetical protein